MSEPLRIAVLGYIVRGPIGGLAWHHLQYVEGLVRLGHDVRFVEDSDDFPSCYDPSRHVVDCDPSYGIRFATRAFDALGLGDAWSYFDAHRNSWLGNAGAEEFCRTADIVMNVSGVNPLRDWTSRAPVRMYVDTDPLFSQIRNLTDVAARARTEEHNSFFTFGENIGTLHSEVPADGFDWQPTRQPIVLSRWNVRSAPIDAPYTTVMQWQSYPSVEFEGRSFGAKAQSFEEFGHVPSMTRAPLEIALGGESAPRESLEKSGWRLCDPLEVAREPEDYQRYIASSRGEVTVAKHGYVASNCGWFSERSAAYLASGRPVITQHTGFNQWLPTGEGLLGFSCPEELVASIDQVESDHARHSSAARELAREFFDSDVVLSSLLDRVTATA